MRSIHKLQAPRTSNNKERATERFTKVPLVVVASLSALLGTYTPALAGTAQPFACNGGNASVVTDTSFPQNGYGHGRGTYILATSAGKGKGKCGCVVTDLQRDRNGNSVIHGEILLMLKGNADEAKESVTVRFVIQPHPGLDKYVVVDKPLTDFWVHQASGTALQCRIDAAKVYSGEGLRNLNKFAVIVDGKAAIKVGYVNFTLESGGSYTPDKVKTETGGCDLIN